MKNSSSFSPSPNDKSLTDIDAAIAATRFGLGAAPGDIDAAKPNPKQWLKDQLKPVTFSSDFPSASQVLLLNYKFRIKRDAARKAAKSENTNSEQLNIMQDEQKALRPQRYFNQHARETLELAIKSKHSLAWRLFDFFSNHFSVSANGSTMKYLAPTLEREVIANHIFGKFEDLLIAVESHPAMIRYLNNENSFGPNSRIGKRNKKRGLNENLAREILELHTLGVKSGYNQADVTELAKAITGWSTLRRKDFKTLQKDSKKSAFIFREEGHEPGSRKVLKQNYPNTGQKQGVAILKDLARHPATAKHLARKIAVHFVSDNPPSSLVNALSKRWMETQGDIKEVIITLINHQEAWQPHQQKFKTPREFLISIGRASRGKTLFDRRAYNMLKELGQPPFASGSPAGYPDDNASWSGADALHARIEFASAYAKRLKLAASDLAKQSLGALLSAHTELSINRAESQQQARTLFLMSPEFQRR